MRKHLLITGFGAFPGVKINPSERLARHLAHDPGWARLGWHVRGAILPVGYGPTQSALEPLLDKHPHAVLMFGVAAKRKAICIETVARNRASRTQRDATGRLPKTSALDGGPAILAGRAAMIRLRDLVRGEGLPARLSRDAGPYLCNAAYRYALRKSAANVPVVFIHIPRVKRMGDARGLAFAPLLKAARAVARRLVLGARLSA